MIHRGVTLLEVLIVVGIILLLLAILLPVIGGARRQARAANCGAQLRELTRAWTLYAANNRDVLASGRPGKDNGNMLYQVGNGQKYRPRWLASVGGVAGIFAFAQPSPEDIHQSIDNRLLICPEVSNWTSERNASYGYNFQFLGNARLTADKSRWINFPVSLANVQGETVVFADSLGTAAHYPANERTPYRVDGGVELTSLGHHGFMLDPPRMISGGDFCDDNNRGIRSAPHDRHAAAANFAFADQSVRRIKPGAAGYGRNLDDSYKHGGDPLIHNRFFSGTGRDDDPPRL